MQHNFFKNNQKPKTMKKNIYTQPLCQVIEIELESILCDSLDPVSSPSASQIDQALYGDKLW